MENKKEMTYEESIEKLNEILEKLENEDLTLEESVNQFKEGMKLYRNCDNILSKTEGEIKLIIDANEDIEENFLREDE